MSPKQSLNKAVDSVVSGVREVQSPGQPILISIDGRSASGKTTLAAALARVLDCNVAHMDQFYLHPAQRTPQRYASPGGNVDYEEVIRRVIEPWKETGAFLYAPYDAHTDTYGPEIYFPRKPVTLIEGSYSGHPRLWDDYALHIFMTTAPERQIERILQRNGPGALETFKSKWIPLEEEYFRAFRIAERSDVIIET